MAACLTPDAHVLSPVDEIGEGVEVLECVICRDEFVVEDGVLVPVKPTALVALVEEHGSLGWDSHDHGTGLFADPRWAGLEEPRG